MTLLFRVKCGHVFDETLPIEEIPEEDTKPDKRSKADWSEISRGGDSSTACIDFENQPQNKLTKPYKNQYRDDERIHRVDGQSQKFIKHRVLGKTALSDTQSLSRQTAYAYIQ